MHISNCNKNQKLCNEAVDNYPHVLEVFPDCFKTQKMCKKSVNTYNFAIDFVSKRLKNVC